MIKSLLVELKVVLPVASDSRGAICGDGFSQGESRNEVLLVLLAVHVRITNSPVQAIRCWVLDPYRVIRFRRWGVNHRLCHCVDIICVTKVLVRYQKLKREMAYTIVLQRVAQDVASIAFRISRGD